MVICFSRLTKRLNELDGCDNLPWGLVRVAADIRSRFDVAHEAAGGCLSFFAIE